MSVLREQQSLELNHVPHISKMFLADVLAGTLSGLLVSPVVTLVDRAVVEQTVTGQSIFKGLTTHGLHALKHPLSFLGSAPLRVLFTLYTTTYVVSNTVNTASGAAPLIFASTLAVNVPLGIWKDVRFSQLFGTRCVSSPSGPSNLKSATAAFLVRDAITIFGSFTLPGMVSGCIPPSLIPSQGSRDVLTQLMVPMLSQVAATPIHLLGLDLYNRRDGASLRARFARTREHVSSTTMARCFRIVPAFGFGVLANRAMRESLHESFKTGINETGVEC